MPYEVKISPRAGAQIRRASKWWAENRPAAPDAVRLDIRKASSILALQPRIGVLMRQTKTRGVRRVHLGRIRYYLYYRFEAEVVEVLAIWHSSRESSPSL